MAVTAKDCHELTSYYVKLYKAKYGIDPNVNRYSARWGFDALLSGLGKQQAKDLLDYYLTTLSTRKHDLDWFFYNYEKLADNMLAGKEEAIHRNKLMEESRIRAEEWRKSGKSGIANAQPRTTDS